MEETLGLGGQQTPAAGQQMRWRYIGGPYNVGADGGTTRLPASYLTYGITYREPLSGWGASWIPDWVDDQGRRERRWVDDLRLAWSRKMVKIERAKRKKKNRMVRKRCGLDGANRAVLVNCRPFLKYRGRVVCVCVCLGGCRGLMGSGQRAARKGLQRAASAAERELQTADSGPDSGRP